MTTLPDRIAAATENERGQPDVVWSNAQQEFVLVWVRTASEQDCTRRSKFYPDKQISNDPEKCTHAWLRYSGFDECRHCGAVS